MILARWDGRGLAADSVIKRDFTTGDTGFTGGMPGNGSCKAFTTKATKFHEGNPDAVAVQTEGSAVYTFSFAPVGS